MLHRSVKLNIGRVCFVTFRMTLDVKDDWGPIWIA